MSNRSMTDDEVLIMAGTLMYTAASNEAIVFSAFRILSGCRTNIAKSIFYAPDSFEAKKTLLRRLVAIVGDPEDKELIETILKAAQKSNNQRQQIAHSLLIWKGSKRVPYILTPKSNHRTPATKDWKQTLVRPALDAAKDCADAYIKLTQKHRVSPKLVI